MARLYADENIPLSLVIELRRLGHDVVTTRESGQAGQAIPDEEVLAFALMAGRAVLTLNRRHFIRLHGERPDHEGIVVCTVDPDAIGQAARVHAALSVQTDLAGQLVRVIRPG